MAGSIEWKPSRMLTELRLLPGLTTEETTIDRVSLVTQLVRPPDDEGSVTWKASVAAARARAWRPAQYNGAGFLENVDGFVENTGELKGNLPKLKIKAAVASCGCAAIAQLHKKASVEHVLALSIREGKVHDVIRLGWGQEDSPSGRGA